jgi:hypothetical protein
LGSLAVQFVDVYSVKEIHLSTFGLDRMSRNEAAQPQYGTWSLTELAPKYRAISWFVLIDWKL